MAGAALLPHAAVRTAGAVRGFSDSPLMYRMTRGRAWIGVLCFLLVGIVALNVLSLSLSAGAGQLNQQIDDLERRNSSLRGDLAEKLSSTNIESLATELGLTVPAPDDVTYYELTGDGVNRIQGIPAEAQEAIPPDSVTVIPEPASTAPTAPEPAAPASTPAGPAAATTPAPTTPAPSTPAPASGGGDGGGVGL